MLSNLTSQLKELGAEDKYYEVLEEVPRVRKDFGECPLVTPSSQIVGTQAVMNVVAGERYKMVTKESKDLLSGKYGKTVKPFNPEVQKKCIGDAEVITCRPADLGTQRAGYPGKGDGAVQGTGRGCSDLRSVPAGGDRFLQIQRRAGEKGRCDRGRYKERRISGIIGLTQLQVTGKQYFLLKFKNRLFFAKNSKKEDGMAVTLCRLFDPAVYQLVTQRNLPWHLPGSSFKKWQKP